MQSGSCSRPAAESHGLRRCCPKNARLLRGCARVSSESFESMRFDSVAQPVIGDMTASDLPNRWAMNTVRQDGRIEQEEGPYVSPVVTLLEGRSDSR